MLDLATRGEICLLVWKVEGSEPKLVEIEYGFEQGTKSRLYRVLKIYTLLSLLNVLIFDFSRKTKCTCGHFNFSCKI